MKIEQSGPWGEKIAAQYLLDNGYCVLTKNFRCRFGEIDIIACDGSDYILFVEVKTRKSNLFGEAREYVGFNKQSKIIKTAEYYLAYHDSTLQPRFDVVEVYYDDNGSVTAVNHFPDAFR